MTELVKIEERGGIPTVNARELHDGLEVGRDFSNWIKDRIEKYGFIEGQDFVIDSPNLANQTGRGGDRRSIDYYLTLDMAKELAMVENNEKGREIRRYFIEVEKKYREQQPVLPTGQKLIALALIEAQRVIEGQARLIETQKPAVQFYHDVTGSKDAIEMSQAAKILDMGMGRNTLFDFLRKHSVLRENNEPYQKYVDAGWFRVIEQKYTVPDGETRISIKTLVYQKGLDGIAKLIRTHRKDADSLDV